MASYYAGFGSLLGTDDDGLQTFLGYGQVKARVIGNAVHIWGEALIDANADYQADHYKTGISLAAVLTALGLTGTFSLDGTAHNYLIVYKYDGHRYTQGQSNYGYGMLLLPATNPLFLIAGRYYTTSGDASGWETSQRGAYMNTNSWVFSFNLTKTS